MSDYNFLEECTRFVEARKCDKLKKFSRYNKNLPTQLYRLRNAGLERKITIKFLLDNFTRRINNTTYYDYNKKEIYWRIEWIFPNAENLKFIDEKLNENENLSKILEKYLNPNENSVNPSLKYLEFYQSRGISNLKILLKSEGIRKCSNRFYELDIKKNLKENFENKIIVEYPIIYIIFNDITDNNYELIDSDDDIETETKEHQNNINEFNKKIKNEIVDQCSTKNLKRFDKELQENLERLQIAKKQKERKKRRMEYDQEPQNYLFANEKMWDLMSSSDEDDGNVTEEEDNVACKKIKEEFLSPPKRIKIE